MKDSSTSVRSDPSRIATKFNNFFANALVNCIPDPPNPHG